MKLFYVKNKDAVCKSKKFDELKKIVKSKRYFKKQKVQSETDKIIGTLIDFEIDRELGMLTQIAVKKKGFIIHRKCLIPRKDIIKVDRKTITVSKQKKRTLIPAKKAEPVVMGPAH